MRPLALALLFPAVVLWVAMSPTPPAVAQPPDFPAPKTFPPDDATLKTITDKTAELKKATEKNTDPDVLVYLKAAEWIVKHGEWFTDKSAQQTVAVLDAGLERAKNADKKPWLEVRGKPIARGYKSKVDGSVQPYSVRFPDDFDAKKKYRLDVVLHGRDSFLTEVKFIAGKEAAKKGKPLDHFEVEIYGRGNNAYRWAGEADVFEVIAAVRKAGGVDESQVVLRGFSMGGAGTWHLGLHHPFDFAVIGPGAGFTTTREYIGDKKFGTQPDYIEKCLHIYDAVDYAENNFIVPVVAYSGEKDKQKLAADLIEARLKDFKEPHSFTHVIAPGLEHSQPADWQAKLELEYQKHLKEPRPEVMDRFRFVTYTPKFLGGDASARGRWAAPIAQLKQYEKTVVDGTFKDGKAVIVTENVRLLAVMDFKLKDLKSLTIDGQAIAKEKDRFPNWFERKEGKWEVFDTLTIDTRLWKRFQQCGPIDDMFTREFGLVLPSEKPWHEEMAKFADARREEFAKNWDKHFRGELPVGKMEKKRSPQWGVNMVLFGDPQSNPMIAEVLPKLPITWTKEKLVVNGKEYDPKTHLPVLIYPNPFGRGGGSYVVINSGHTFRAADLKGTNALLYPRLGDWAVLKPKPTKDDPAGFEVIDAGLFDENWQFKK